MSGQITRLGRGPRIGRGAVAATVLVLAGLVVSGCPGGSDQADKAGGSGAPATLRIGTPDRPSLPGGQAISEFADRVDQLSGGSIRIEPVFGAWEGTADPRRWDQAVAERVERGELEMGLVPARAFDALGVTSLQALQAPFLIDNEALADEVVMDDGLAADMLAGLDEAGLAGLSLWPEGLRRPLGFEKPFLTLSDFQGATIRAPYSRATYDLLRTLGARPVDLTGPNLARSLASGEVAGAETSLASSGLTLPRPGVATSNLVFFPKVNVLVINPDVLDALDDEEADLLLHAAADTRGLVIEQGTTEAEAAHAYCDDYGGGVAAATEADVAQIVDAAAPVYDRLESDPQTKDLIERIRDLKSDASPASVPSSCGSRSLGHPATEAAGGARSGPDHDQAIPDGVYRTEFSADEFLDAGVPSEFAHENAGIWTLKFSGGRFVESSTYENGQPAPDCRGRSAEVGKRVAISWSPTTECTGDMTAILKIDANGDLRFEDVRSPVLGDRVIWRIHTWMRID